MEAWWEGNLNWALNEGDNWDKLKRKKGIQKERGGWHE